LVESLFSKDSMEYRDISTFNVVANTLSFNRAARVLHTAQSTISTRVAALEEELGVRLFDRIGRKVLLTEAGQRLRERAQRILELEKETREWVSGASASAGAVTLRVPESLCVHRLTGVIRRFREQAPCVRLGLITCALDGLAVELRQGTADLAFVYADSINARDLRVEFLGSEPLVLAAAPRHALAQQTAVDPTSLAGVPLLLSTADCSYRRMLETLLAEHDVKPGIGIEFSSVAALKRSLEQGLGAAILPAIAIQEEIRRKSVVPLPWTGDPLETGILMIWHREKWLSPNLKALMELVRERLRRQGLKQAGRQKGIPSNRAEGRRRLDPEYSYTFT
jgi:DNA-binding transcriptional LysR family regulator